MRDTVEVDVIANRGRSGGTGGTDGGWESYEKMFNAQDLTEEELSTLKGDAVGNSAHSSLWILRILKSLHEVIVQPPPALFWYRVVSRRSSPNAKRKHARKRERSEPVAILREHTLLPFSLFPFANLRDQCNCGLFSAACSESVSVYRLREFADTRTKRIDAFLQLLNETSKIVLTKDLEDNLCLLWDMSVDEDVQSFLREYNFFDLAGCILTDSIEPRMEVRYISRYYDPWLFHKNFTRKLRSLF